MLIFTKCSDSMELSENDSVYNFIVKDVFTEEVMPGVDLLLFESFGGSSLLDTEMGTTDSNGELQLITTYNKDSVSMVISENMLDPNLTIWQPVRVESEFHGLSSLEQNGSTFSFRPIINQNDLITVNAFYAAQCEIVFSREMTDLEHTISVSFTLDNGDEYVSNIGLQLPIGSDFDSRNIKIPDGKNIKVVYEVGEVNMVDWSVTKVLKDSTFISGRYEENVSLLIELPL